MRPNLLPTELVARRRARRALVAWARMVVLVSVLATAANLLVWNEVRRRASARDALRAEVAELEARVIAAEALAHDRVTLRRETALLRSTRRTAPVRRLLDAVGTALPPAAYLTTVDLQRPEIVAGEDAAPATLTLIGRAPSLGDVGRALRGLRASGMFERVTLTGTGDTRAREGVGEITFEIACRPEEGSGD